MVISSSSRRPHSLIRTPNRQGRSSPRLSTLLVLLSLCLLFVVAPVHSSPSSNKAISEGVRHHKGTPFDAAAGDKGGIKLTKEAKLSRSTARLLAFGLSHEEILEVKALWLSEQGGKPARLRRLQQESSTAESSNCEGPHFAEFNKSSDWLHLLGAMICICCGAIAAGLTLGMVSLDPLELQLKARAGTAEEKVHSKKLLPLVKNHHLLLVSLLLFNAFANETLPLFLENLVPPAVAIAISVTLVLFFGEIIPSAIFTGPRQLELAASMAKPAWLIIGVFFPFSYPISIVLDGLLGHESLRKYTRKELAALMDVQQDLHEEEMMTSTSAQRRTPSMYTSPLVDGGAGGSINGTSSDEPFDHPLTEHEANMVNGILENAHQTVETSDVMVSVEDVFALSTQDVVSMELREELVNMGFSRVPVYEGSFKGNIRGFFHVKKLIVTDASASIPVADLPLVKPLIIGPGWPLSTLLQEFRAGTSHLAVVSRDPEATQEALGQGLPLEGDAAVIGITTMEDVIEELLQQEILDENDRLRRRAHLKALMLLKGTRGMSDRGELITERGATGQLTDMADRVAKSAELTEIISQLEMECDDNSDDETGETSQVNFMTKKLLKDIVSSSSTPPPLKPRTNASSSSSSHHHHHHQHQQLVAMARVGSFKVQQPQQQQLRIATTTTTAAAGGGGGGAGGEKKKTTTPRQEV